MTTSILEEIQNFQGPIERDFSNKDLFNYVYIPVLHDRKRYIFLWGSAGSGKSKFEAQKEIIKSYEINNNILCIRKVKDTLKKSCFAELKRIINEWELQDDFIITQNPLLIKNKITGCEFIFSGMDDPEKVKSIEGVAREWIEEATELTKDDFDQLDLRLRGKKEMQITCTFNPVDVDSWLNNDFCVYGNTKNQTVLHTTYNDNRFVGPEYDEVMQRLKKTNPNYYKIYALGEWGILEGLIFQNWSIIREIPKDAVFIGRAIDFGFTNDPSACISCYRRNGKIIFHEEFYETGLRNVYTTPKDKDKSIVGKLENLGIDKKQEIFGDSAEPKSIDEIHACGFNIKSVEKGKDSIIVGIDIMLSYEILITSESSNLQKEFKKYVRKIDKNGKRLNVPIDNFNHAIDACRYISLMKLMNKNKKRKIKILIPNL